MPDATDLSAAPSPAAALPDAPPTPSEPTTQASSPVPEAQTLTPGPDGRAPAGSVAPDTTPAPAPAYDPSEVERWKQEAAEAATLRQQMLRDRQAAEAAQQQQELAQQAQQMQQWADQELDRAEAYARSLNSDDEARAYVRQARADIFARITEYNQYVQQQQAQQYQQREYAQQLERYPDYLKQQFGLSDEQTALLRGLANDREMTLLAQTQQMFNQQLAQERARLQAAATTDYTTQQTDQLRQSGLTSAGGVNTATSTPQITPGSREELRPVLARILQHRAG